MKLFEVHSNMSPNKAEGNEITAAATVGGLLTSQEGSPQTPIPLNVRAHPKKPLSAYIYFS